MDDNREADVFVGLSASSHLAVTGRTRSGKSVLVYGVLAQLAGRRNVIVVGVDPSGIVFNALGEALGGSRLRVSTLRQPERARQVLAEVVALMDARIDGLLSSRRDKLDSFTEALPLVVVLMEEYPGTLAALQAADVASGARPADRVETAVRAAVQRLALEGAKVGIRLLLVAQRADASLLTGVLRSQLTTRISFAQDADGLRMLHEGLSPDQLAAGTRFAPGQAYFESPDHPVPVAFRADFIDYAGLLARFAAAREGAERPTGDTRASVTPCVTSVAVAGDSTW